MAALPSQTQLSQTPLDEKNACDPHLAFSHPFDGPVFQNTVVPDVGEPRLTATQSDPTMAQYIEFQKMYLASDGAVKNELAIYFLNQLPRVFVPLNKYVQEQSCKTYCLSLDAEWMEAVKTLLKQYERMPFTKQNGEILVSRFYHDQRELYAASLHHQQKQNKARDLQLWRFVHSRPLVQNSRDEPRVAENAGGNLQLKRSVLPKHIRDAYLNATGVGMPRSGAHAFDYYRTTYTPADPFVQRPQASLCR